MLSQGSRYLDFLGLSQLLLTPWSRVLPEHLTFPQLVKKFPAVSGTRRFIAAFKSAPPPVPNSELQQYIRWSPNHFLKSLFNIIVPSTPRSSTWYAFIAFSHQNPLSTFPVPYTCHMPLLSHSSCFDHLKNIWCIFQIIILLDM